MTVAAYDIFVTTSYRGTTVTVRRTAPGAERSHLVTSATDVSLSVALKRARRGVQQWRACRVRKVG